MLAWARDSLWPTMHPQSINYAFMQEPLLSGEVWVAFDHTARLLEAFNAQPDDFVAFPAPAGPEGRAFMPVIVGLGIPNSAPNPEGAQALIEYLTRPDVQAMVLRDMASSRWWAVSDTADLPAGVAIELEAVDAQANAANSFPALLPVGLGERGGEINQIFRNAFDRVVLNGEDIARQCRSVYHRFHPAHAQRSLLYAGPDHHPAADGADPAGAVCAGDHHGAGGSGPAKRQQLVLIHFCDPIRRI
jgi:multiple sugar transport system substrate-binding protein